MKNIVSITVLLLKVIYKRIRRYKYSISKLFLSNNNVYKGFCNICGKDTWFFLRENSTYNNSMECINCGGIARYRLISLLLVNNILKNKSIDKSLSLLDLGKLEIGILDTSYMSPLYKYLKNKGIVYMSEYLPGLEKKIPFLNLYHQDLMKISFSRESIDIIITSEVFEHITEPLKAFEEIYRILKPGGIHIFTIPYNENSATRSRILIEDGMIQYKLPKLYHKNPLSLKGSLVCTDFGYDLIDNLKLLNFQTELITLTDNKLGFYNTSVFISKKIA